MLTLRQLEVLRLLGEGYTNKEIAKALEIAVRTVRTHVEAIFEHLEVENRTQAVLAAQRAGLLQARPFAGDVAVCAPFPYLSETAAARDFNMLLVLKFPNAASQDPNPERYKAFMADLRAMIAEDKQNNLVEGYEELRTFFGEQNFRRINFK